MGAFALRPRRPSGSARSGALTGLQRAKPCCGARSTRCRVERRMRTSLIAVAVLTHAITARAQPADPPPLPRTGAATTEPAPTKPDAPVAAEAPPAVLALDGEARNFERSPVGSSVRGSFVLRWFGRGIGTAVRLFLVPIRGVIQLEARWNLLSKLRILVNKENTLGLVPTVVFQSAFGLNVGARAFVDNYLGAGEYVAISANTGGSVVQSYQLDASLPHLFDAPIYVRATVRYQENENLFFSGIGNPGARTAADCGRGMGSRLSQGVHAGARRAAWGHGRGGSVGACRTALRICDRPTGRRGRRGGWSPQLRSA